MTNVELEVGPAPWFPVPRQWPAPDASDPQEWAELVASGTLGEGPDRDAAAALLLALAHRRQDPDHPSDLTFVRPGATDVVPTTVDVVVLPAEGDAVERHRYLGRADVPGQVGAVQVDEVFAAHLGTGTSVLRFDPVERGGRQVVTGSLRCFWRVDDVDVAVALSAPDVGELLASVPALQELVDTLVVVRDAPGPTGGRTA